MQELRDRARANMTTVLLTLLSIVQALAIEILWTKIRESSGLFDLSWPAALYWIQLVTTTIGLILIWIVYASHVVRLRWVPTTTDSIYPFIIGIMEFISIELLSVSTVGYWMICNAAIFALMVWITHRTMKRARLDGANDMFFKDLAPATISDFFPVMALILSVAAFGTYLEVSDSSVFSAIAGALLVTGILLHQFLQTAHFWQESLRDRNTPAARQSN